MGSIPPPSIGDLQVSVEDLDAAATYVERLRQYIDDTIKYEMERIKERMKGDSNNAQTVPNGTPFGAYEDARMQWRALETSTANMEAHLTTLSQKLAALKEGTEEIAKAFRDTEARNGANGKEIERLLESAAPPPTASGAPTYPYTA
ncbi:hypothetical protein [Micromonospora saelicesensis]|uniref:Uncharacterized protein n=1 Tax=Micromonospora saelicesensis TaxID=285676 RepID=A0A1C5AI10_9ACTN|nr:hypothetical protein [Micromonospora saelicesensis]RAO03159.1 hypothetical protein GAR05_01072 [Micromonospora saelicesensis]RAO42740.1 hypothetical protein GAR06_04909 [Micromonospora saelicesensis]RAO48525.1 hypothetical protein PSN01_04724 [Micromonospora saelicesensis]RAO52386.1 hypothetical protein LUPAC06_05692 [Micromonospora saelicesensis]SCF44843.1 hypothetical protein GA0070561_0324 [Micromonospora saelicesensis]